MSLNIGRQKVKYQEIITWYLHIKNSVPITQLITLLNAQLSITLSILFSSIVFICTGPSILGIIMFSLKRCWLPTRNRAILSSSASLSNIFLPAAAGEIVFVTSAGYIFHNIPDGLDVNVSRVSVTSRRVPNTYIKNSSHLHRVESVKSEMQRYIKHQI